MCAYKFPALPARDYSASIEEPDILNALPKPPAGMRWRVTVENDDGSRAPWEECDGHGPVTGWKDRDKRPGELILNEDRRSKRFYDFAEAVRIAKRDGWSCEGMPEGVTPGERASLAARADFEYLQAWCGDEWRYVGVSVWLETSGGGAVPGQDQYEYALWGIESFATGYLVDVARELAEEALRGAGRAVYPVTECGI